MPGTVGYQFNELMWDRALVAAVENGTVEHARLDDMAVRVLSAWYMAKQDIEYPPVNFHSFNASLDRHVDVKSKSAAALIREFERFNPGLALLQSSCSRILMRYFH